MDKKNLCDLDVAGQKVLVRVDYNVPMDETGKITDDTRIRASLETIKYLLEHKAAVILMAHLGRPKGQVNIKYSLAPVAKHLAKLLNMPVAFAGDCIGEEAEKAVQKLKPGKILMLENLRFHKEEEKNDMDFAEKLASLADLYVNDGFGVSHRAHASVEGLRIFCLQQQAFYWKRNSLCRTGCGKSTASLCCYHWRCQGFRQDRRDRKSFGKSRYPADRRRYGQYFFSCSRA